MPSDLMNVISSVQAIQAQQAAYEQAMYNQLQAAQNQRGVFGNQTLTNTPLTVRLPISPATPVTDLFFKIPSVAYLVEKIPAAKVVIAKDGVTAAYLNEAKAQGLSLRQQCKDLGIPWSARLLAANEVSEDTVRLAMILEPTVFVQAKPKERVHEWAARILILSRDGAAKAVITWAAWHVLDIRIDDLDYLARVREIAPSTSPKTVRERSVAWHAQFRQPHLTRGGQPSFERDVKAKLPAHVDWERRTFHGYEFHPLKTYGDFEDEGAGLRHCVATRFSNAKDGHRIYFSLRLDGKRVATAEYEKVIFSNKWTLREIKSLSNRMPAPSAKEAAVEFEGVISGKIVLANEPAPKAAVEIPPMKAVYDSSAWTG